MTKFKLRIMTALFSHLVTEDGYQRKDVDYKWSIKEPMKIKPGISVGREYGLEG